MKEEIEKFCREFEIINYIINDDFSIDVHGDINFNLHKFTNCKIPYKFNIVYGDFLSSGCGLLTLENSPNKVYGNYSCSGNYITSLKGCPDFVSGNFACFSNSRLENINDYIGDLEKLRFTVNREKLVRKYKLNKLCQKL